MSYRISDEPGAGTPPRSAWSERVRGALNRWGPQGAVTMLGIIVAAGLFGYGGWQRRWMADDGLIVLRTVRNLLAGNGPVFNAGERVEVNTSTAWTYVMWLFGWITRARLEYVAVGVCLALSIAAMVFVMLGSARLLRHSAWARRVRGPVLLLPGGVFIYAALPPARDFATSGLEVGLLLCWLGAVWWLLVRWATTERPSTASVLSLGFLAGLSWLVRPETVLLGAPVLLLLFCVRQSWRRRAVLVGVSGLVPVGYQIWRMGYYALPYPNTAVAKDAGEAKWGKGLIYLADLVQPYVLWVPLVLLVVIAAVMWGPAAVRAVSAGAAWARAKGSGVKGAGAKGAGSAADGAAAGAPGVPGEYRPPRRIARPVAARLRRAQDRLHSPVTVTALIVAVALVWLVYVLRVGGDFMHGRVLLPVVFLLIAPLAMIPVPIPRCRDLRPADAAAGLRGVLAPAARTAVPVLGWIGVIAWALTIVNVPGAARPGTLTRDGIVDERAFYVTATGHAHPITSQDYLDFPRMRALVDTIRATPEGGLLIQNGSLNSWTVIPPAVPPPPGEAQHTVYFINLGMPGMNTPLDVKVYDTVGLAFPLAAHTPRITYGRIGHDKNLPPDWVIALQGLADTHEEGMPQWLDEDWVKQAETAITCPQTEYLLDSYTGELTWGRWWENFRHAWSLAAYQIDPDPEYEIERCDLVPPPLDTPPR
ncbi:hypothetical protein [Tomitella cavernea]|uniref:hypothetical protein n=1 Tax=Tomitella cavernea TaxID=1387982 RepID=UPI0019042058|nr:hypothetical protein [Tomitella cavernea]